MKRFIRLSFKLTALAFNVFNFERNKGSVVFLMYHRITGDTNLELDLRYSDFVKQFEYLASIGKVISIAEAVILLAEKNQLQDNYYVITFDDAFEDFYTLALPLIKQHQIPVTLYTPSQFVLDPSLIPISKDFKKSSLLKPVTIDMLKEIHACEWVTLAAHTHSHSEVTALPETQLLDEIIISDEFFKKNLGFTPEHFAYPRGIWNETVEELFKKRYETISLVGGGAVKPDTFNKHRIPRVPILRSDRMFWFKHRINGKLKLEEKLTAILTGRKPSY